MTLLTIREASQLIGRTSATIRRYIRTGRLKAEKVMGKFGEEYKIRREDLVALGFPTATESLPVRAEPAAPARRLERATSGAEPAVPLSLYNELLLKHEQILVQYGMIRAGGQKLLEYKADAEAKDDDLARLGERYQALRSRAAKEIKFLRKHLRQAEIEIEDRNIEITLLQEKIKRLELAAAGTASLDGFDKNVVDIKEKEAAIARLEVADQASATPYTPPQSWFENHPPRDRGDDH